MELLPARGTGVEGARVGSVSLGMMGSVLLWGSDVEGEGVDVEWGEGKEEMRYGKWGWIMGDGRHCEVEGDESWRLWSEGRVKISAGQGVRSRQCSRPSWDVGR